MMFTKNQPMTFNGFKVVTSPLLPYQRIRLSAEVLVTDKFRTEMNQWLLDMFGQVDCLVMKIDNTIVFSEEAYKKLKARQEFENFILYGAGNLIPKGIMRSGEFNG